jgi:hypothetical protein
MSIMCEQGLGVRPRRPFVKVEYLYIDHGSRSLSASAFTVSAIVFTTSTSLREQIARVGLNHHFN